MQWKTLSGTAVPDVAAFVKQAADQGQAVHVGTDSLQIGTKTHFVTVIAVLTPHKGGRVIYSRESVPKIKSLRERLLKEVWRSVDLGLKFTGIVPGDLTIHIDANENLQFKSAQFVQELVGLVVGQGFRYEVKPKAWAATHAADHIVRLHGKVLRAGSQPALNTGVA